MGTVTEAELRDAYASMEQSKRKLFEETREMIEAAQKLGMPRSEISGILERDVGDEAGRDLLNGIYKPYKPSSQFLRTDGAPAETRRLYDERRRFIMKLATETPPEF
jgi:hypothetical protein